MLLDSRAEVTCGSASRYSRCSSHTERLRVPVRTLDMWYGMTTPTTVTSPHGVLVTARTNRPGGSLVEPTVSTSRHGFFDQSRTSRRVPNVGPPQSSDPETVKPSHSERKSS